MPAATTDLFRKGTNNFSTTLGSGIGSSDTTISLASTTNLPTDTGIDLVIDRVDANGNKTPALREYVRGVISGTTLITVQRGKGNSTAQTHSIGAVVEYVFDQDTLNDMVTGIMAHANQDGSLISAAVRTALNQTAATGAGWTTIGSTPNTTTDNGNRSYTCVFNGVDLTSTLSPGMRLQLTRTVTAPTQSTSLNGTTQYWSKTTPAGMTFTNNFVVSAWVKLSSYASGVTASPIAGRIDATQGWWFGLNSSGQLLLSGHNAALGNYNRVISYQSVPLNKWVHVSAQLDMSTATLSPTTNYTMIDGVDVPASKVTAGTAPTSLVQAGNLTIGTAQYGGTEVFNGKIAQVAIYSAKVTEATIAASKNQTLVGTETSLISAYSFNSTANDLNANANNLTANNGALATNADTPFTQTLGLTGYTAGTTNFGIVQSAVFSTNTTVVLQVPEGDTLPTSGGISAVSYSTQKTPFGFPSQRSKWQVKWLATGVMLLIGTNNTWGTGVSTSSTAITIPAGEWQVTYDFARYADRGAGVNIELYQSLSTSASAETDTTWTSSMKGGSGTGLTFVSSVATRTGSLSLSAATVYYGLFKGNSSDGTLGNHSLNGNAAGASSITAENAYL